MTIIRPNTALIPPHLISYVAVDDVGLPRFWPTVWETLHGGKLKDSTFNGKLTAIGRVYEYVAETTGEDCLDRLLATLDFGRLVSLLEGFFTRLRNEAARRGRNDSAATWKAASTFIYDVLEDLGTAHTAHEVEFLRAEMLRLERRINNFHPPLPAKRKVIRALPAGVVEDLYDLVDPDSVRNPFRSEGQRWRNFCLFLLYLHFGLRRSEALILPTGAMKGDFDHESGKHVDWLNIVETNEDDDPFDSRRKRPRIKTLDSRRQIPVSAEFADIITQFVVDYRGRLPHPFLFSSNRTKPLSLRAVNDVFEVLTPRLSEGAQKDLRDRLRDEAVTPHTLRHTAAVYRLCQFIEDGDEMKLALQKLRAFFGWAHDSRMPQYYAAAYFEGQTLRSVWRKKFDSRVDILRTLASLDDCQAKNKE